MTPREALVYIDRLPSDSAYAEAMAQDDDLAEQYGDRADVGETRPRIIGWSPEVAAITTVADRLSELIALVSAVAGGKPGTPVFERRPETALERFRTRQDAAAFDYLIDLVEEARAGKE